MREWLTRDGGSPGADLHVPSVYKLIALIGKSREAPAVY